MSESITPGPNFEDAFAQFLTDEAPTKPQEPAQPAPEPAQPPQAAQEPAQPPAEPAQEPQEPVQEPQVAQDAPEPPAEPQEPAQTPAEPQADADMLARLANLLKQARPAEEPAPPAPQAPTQQAEDPVYTPEEQKLLEEYQKEWPDVSKAEALVRRGEYRAMVGYVFQEFAKEMRPIMDLVQTLAERTHLGDLHTAVPDYDDVREKVIDWASKQPSYLQAAYKHVIEKGTSDEIADLIGRYKRETAPAQTPQSPPPAQPRKTELPQATKQAAAALAPVGSKRSGTPQTVDPQDFAAAFAEFADKV